MNTKKQINAWLDDLVEQLITRITCDTAEVFEGTVLCTGPAPYRRLDCRGRALAYVRSRPRKRVVRIDITGLWRAPTRSRLIVPAAGGAATLMLYSEADIDDAVRFLLKTVGRTTAPRPLVGRVDSSHAVS